MNLISKAHRYAAKYGGLSAAAAKLGIPRSTLYDIMNKSATKRQKTTAETPVVKPAPEPERPVWMQSLHHESAHLVYSNGQTACSRNANGAKITAGMVWHPATIGRKCFRCMKHEEKELAPERGS